MRTWISSWLRIVVREPLIYFAVLGGLVFLLHEEGPRITFDANTIVITPEIVELLRTQHTANTRSPPTDAELDAVIDGFVEEEVLYRYALALGLDQNDAVVRRRLVQKARVTIEDAEPIDEPQESQLREYFEANAESYRRPARVSFRHVFSRDDSRSTSASGCTRIKERLDRGEDPETLGQPFALGHEKYQQTHAEVRRVFGDAMADALFVEDRDIWVGPFESRYGCHVARILGRQAEHLPEFREVRDRVALDWRRDERQRRNQAAYDRLREGYRVVRDAGVTSQ